MLARKQHTKQRSITRILLIVMVAAPDRVLPQPVFDRPSIDTQHRIIAEIREIETQDGPNSANLIPPLRTLGMLYYESGDHLLSLVANRRALEVIRIAYGLHSLEQAPLMRQVIAIHEAMGQDSAAWRVEQDLLALAERHHDDLRSVSIFRETADRRMATLQRYLAGEFPQQLVLGCYYGWPRASLRGIAATPEGMERCSVGSRDHAIQSLTVEAQKFYAKAISVVHRKELYSSDVLRELEMDLIRCSDLLRGYDGARSVHLASMKDVGDLGLRMEPWRSWTEAMKALADLNVLLVGGKREDYGPWRPDHYGIARDSLERLFAYSVMTGAPWQQQADALIQISDWDLLHSNNAAALRVYEDAYQRLVQMDMEQAAINQIFRPEIPVVLPAFRPNPLRTNETSKTNGHIDVGFEISRYGESRNVEILDMTTNVRASVVDDLVRLIKRSRFRPGIDESGSISRSHVVVRYFANE